MKKKIIVLLLLVMIVIVLWFINNIGKDTIENKDNVEETEQIEEIENIEVEEISEVIEGLEILSDEDFNFEALKEKGQPIMLFFGADWCSPCKEMKPIVVDLYNEYKDVMVIRYIHFEKASETVSKYNIESIPTQIFFNADGSPYIPQNEEIMSKMTLLKDDVTDEHKLTIRKGALSKEKLLIVFKEMGLDIKN